MHHSQCMTVLNTSNQLTEIRSSRFLIKSPVRHNSIKELASHHEFQHNEDCTFTLHDFQQTHHRGMIDHAHDGDLFLDLHAHLLFGYLGLVHDFDRHFSARGGVHSIFHPDGTEPSRSASERKKEDKKNILSECAFPQGFADVIFAHTPNTRHPLLASLKGNRFQVEAIVYGFCKVRNRP